MRLTIHGLLLLVAGLVSGTTATTTTRLTRRASANETKDGLHSLMVATGKVYFGTATDTNNFDDEAYQTIATNRKEFGMFTPENSQKWMSTEPFQGNFSFAQADRVAQRARSNRQLLRCHTLTWHSQLPPFVQNTTWNPAALTALLTAHLTTVMRHYAGRCYAWDVVNEALAENGTMRSDPPSVFLSILGPSYIPLSFTIAAAADPSAKLYYNDFNLETIPAKADGAVGIVKQIRAAGARIDGVGFQAHMNVGQTPKREELAGTLRRFAALGVDVAITELDIAHGKVPVAPGGVEEVQQARDYAAVVGACLDVEACVGITVWQFTDRYSWVPSTFPGKGQACMFAEDYRPKLAYDAVVGLLKETAGLAPAGSAESVFGSDGGKATTPSPVNASSTTGSGEVHVVGTGLLE
ncbi:glycoside hydrolase superfamily [Dichotomopilus funicola]|uniref:Beta-xylanase n=1 Tax=Dichotomopilus funicola TaxID=1934379 RepID=A0AAN6VBI1_9PEZI|nr:glycoside hydrolase superfamily [Dichotomopilus funicola]